ncbi:DNA (cytosine-5-)-methyltransferase [Candidatus Poseidoniales archaeon]|nr:DNA (cytosine-5-)-methyltransferase [Candidatus Poseidoniales archaeon]
MQDIRYVELFAGIGGFGLAFNQSLGKRGLKSKLVLASEIDVHASETFDMNFSHNPLSDVREIENLPPHDILFAGFPCQPFSYAGVKKGFGETRGTLFFEIMRLVDTSPPKVMILENVRGILTNDQGRTIQTIEAEIRKRGYSFQLLVLNSANFGVPQNRVRTYMVCSKDETDDKYVGLESDVGPPDSHSISSLGEGFSKVGDILEENPDSSYNCSTEFFEGVKMALGGELSTIDGRRFIDYRGGHSIHSWEMGLKGQCTRQEIEFMNKFILQRRNKKFGSHRDGKMLSKEQISTFWKDDLDGILTTLTEKNYLKIVDENRYKPVSGNYSFEVFKILDKESISITVVSSDCSRLGIYHQDRLRRLTPREVARIQGFPDDFKLHKAAPKAYFQLGNAVSVPVVKKLCDLVLDKLLSNKD